MTLGPTFKINEIIIYTPICAGAIGVSFDVGYFWGVDINYFTFFSLSEHVVFALQALPIAIAIVFSLGLGLILGQLVAGKAYHGEHDRAVEKKRIKLVNRAIYGGVLFNICLSTFFFIYGWWEIGAVFTFAAIYFAFVRVFRPILLNLAILVSVAAIFAIFVAVCFGHIMGRTYREATNVSHAVVLTDGTLVSGRIIRSGERGLLFVDLRDASVDFIVWSRIASVKTQKLR